MLKDIYQEPFKIKIAGKEYFLQFDHASYASFEKRVQKSIYEIYDILISQKSLMLNDSVSMLLCSLLKHHSVTEINEVEEIFKRYPGLWFDIKEDVMTAFLVPLLPPKAVEKIECSAKKKEQTKKKKTSKQ